jgi:Zn-dependent peptidase ImmA (M78 family)/transcriptional regulator with XRE-family HTH domain
MQNVSKFDGTRLRLARQLSNLTLADIGEKTEVSRQYIQKLESDSIMKPADDMLQALAELLGVRPSFFFESKFCRVYEENCHFRKRKTTPKYLQSKAVSHGTIFNIVLNYIDETVKLPIVNFPSHKAIESCDIELAANELRLAWGVGIDRPISNLTALLEYYGAIVHPFSGVSDKIDAFSYIYHDPNSHSEDEFRPVIVRNTAKESRSRYRFDIAHELGHLILHRDTDTEDSLEERQADRFASAFLLPKEAFCREMNGMRQRINWRRLCEMKVRWGVSLQALIRRAFDLGIISATQYRSANIYISKKGWRTNEPCERDIKEEIPRTVEGALSLMNDHNISMGKIAQDLSLSEGLLTTILKCH